MFNISYVVVTVKARLAGFDRRLEEAAMDLGANEITTFWKVTFPLILPGHHGRGAAGIQPVDRRLRHHQLRVRTRRTRSRSGSTRSSSNALPVQINVIGSIIFIGAVALVGATTLRSGRAARIR